MKKLQNTLKRIATMAMTICIITTMLPTAALPVRAQGTVKTFDGQTFMLIEEDCTINIESNITQQETLVIKSGNVTINGGGNTISVLDYIDWPDEAWRAALAAGNFEYSWAQNSIIVGTDANVTINNLTIDYSDINHNGASQVANQVVYVAGMLTANNLNIAKAPDRAIHVAAGGVCNYRGTISGYSDHGSSPLTAGVDVYGTFTMTGGEICQSTLYAFDVRSNGVVNMNGGSVHGIAGSGDNSYSSGVYVEGGTLNIDGGEIYDTLRGITQMSGTVNLKSGSIHDISGTEKAAIQVESGSFHISGGSIYNCGKDIGSVVLVGGTATMTGGEIKDCTGGILLYTSPAVTLTGGKITNCTGIGGVYYLNGSLTVGGSAKVTGNSRNIYLPTGNTITVSSTKPLNADALLGVTMKTPGVFTVSGSFADNAAARAVFTSDNSSYAVTAENNEAKLVSGVTVTFNANGHGTAPAAQTVVSGEKATEPDAPTADGQVFGGWYKEAACTNRWDFDSDTVDTATTLYAKWLEKEAAPSSAVFTATGSDSGILSGVEAGMKYSIDGGLNWEGITQTTAVISADVTVANGILIYKSGNGTTTTDSDVYEIAVTKAAAPDLSPTQPEFVNGKGSIPTTTEHEYSTDNGTTWKDCAGTLSNLSSGTYLIRARAHDTTLASDAQNIVIRPYVPSAYIVTVTNGTGSGSYAADATVTITANAAPGGQEFDQWTTTDGVTFADVNSAMTTFTMPAKAVTVTATYKTAETAPMITKAPAAIAGLVYNGRAQALITAGEVTGGTLYYAVTENGVSAPAASLYTTSIPTATGTGTYYVWYKAVGDGTDGTDPVCITVMIRQLPSTSVVVPSTSTQAPVPTVTIAPEPAVTPASDTEVHTVPVSNENTVDISVNISDGNAVVQEITQADLDKIIGTSSGDGSGEDKKTDDNTISIDVSGAKSEVTSVELSGASVEKIAKTVETSEKVDTVEIKMTNATVELDSTAVSAISEQKEGNTVKLVVENIEQAKLNETQKESLKKFSFVQPFQAYFESAGKEIHDFKGGKATVSIRFTPAAGKDAKYYHMFYIPSNGLIERYATRYLNGMLIFVATHFSYYAIVYDETVENETGEEEVTPSPGAVPTAEPTETATPTTSTPIKEPTASASPSESTEPVTASEKTQAVLAINAGLKVVHNGTSASVQWGKVEGAKYYKVYAAYCRRRYGLVKTIDSTAKCKVAIKKLNGKKLSTTKNIKVYVAAYRTVEAKKDQSVIKKDVRIAKTITGHVVGKDNKKYSNAKKIRLSKKSFVLTKGKTVKVGARTILQYPERKQLSDAHAKEFRYATTDKSIASVNKKGKIRAKKKGSCVIYVYARNGLAREIKITVV